MPNFIGYFFRRLKLIINLAIGFLAAGALPTLATAETWVALGDSITYRASHAPPEGAWTQIVAKQSGHRVINAGINGDNTEDALRRLQRDVLAHNPDRVLIMLGVNDHFMLGGATPQQQVTPERFRHNMEILVKAIQTTGAEVILMTNRPMVVGQGAHRSDYLLPLAAGETRPACGKTLCIYNAIIRNIAAQQTVALIDIWQAVVDRGDGSDRDASVIQAGIDIPGNGFDGVHLGPGGHQLMAEEVLKALADETSTGTQKDTRVP